MSYRFDEEEYPLRTFTERDWGDTRRLLNDGYNTAPLPSQRGRVAPARRWVDSLPRDHHNNQEERSTAFLDHVVLDPGWEANHPPKDMICFTLNETIDHMKKNPPHDRYYAVFIILLLHGVAISLPWNMVFASQKYFSELKLNSTGESGVRLSEYYTSFSPLAFQVPQVIFNLVNTIYSRKRGPSPTCTVSSLLILVTSLIAAVVMAMLDSKTWPSVFFGITMGILVLIGVFSGFLMNNVFGMAAIFPPNYTNAVILGTNIGGVITSVATISSIALSPSLRTCAIYFFLSAIIILLVTFDTFFVLPYLRFYGHYRAIVAMRHSALEGALIKEKRKRPMFNTFKQIWTSVLAVWIVYFTSSVIFPDMLASIRKVDKNLPISDTYWTPLFCFLSFTTFSSLGNLFCLCLKKPGARFVWIPALLRAVIVLPFFLLCNYRPDTRSLAVLIPTDYPFLAGGAVLGLTHGYLGGLGMLQAPQRVETEYNSSAGMMMATTMSLAILCGTNFSRVVQLFVDNIGNG